MNGKTQQLRPLNVISSWETVRFELLNTRICDLGLKIEGSLLERPITRVKKELEKKGIKFQPRFYLTDSWGCPNRVPVVGVPFYLVDRRLRRLEEEQTGWVEDEQQIMMFLRHEVGHAVNYAYRLWKTEQWTEIFGDFAQPYRVKLRPNPASRNYVRHLLHSEYGRLYAQKHPDEDFAETFAVWLTPGSQWRRRYQLWPVMRKLRFINDVVKPLACRPPKLRSGQLLNPVEELTQLLADYYGQRLERYRAAAQGYVDDRLREVFPPPAVSSTMPAALLFRRYREQLSGRIAAWSQLTPQDIEAILQKLEERAAALKLEFPRRALTQKLIDIATLATSLAMDFAYTGRFMG
jgi:hypothetical protein